MKRAYVRALMRMAGMPPREISEELRGWRKIGLTYFQIADVLFNVYWGPAIVRASHRLAERNCDDLCEDEVNRVFAQEICRLRREDRGSAGA